MNLPKFLRSKSGATAVEFALVLPVLLLVLVAIFVYGLYIATSHSVAQLAADAARATVAGLTDTERTEIAAGHIERTAGDFILLSPEKISVTAAPSSADPNILHISIAYDASSLPIWSLDRLVPVPSKTIIRTASIRRGGP